MHRKVEKLKIMTVENNELFAMILDFNLKDAFDAEIRNVSSGEECIENLKWQPDLILMDNLLPKMNGLETLKKLKERNPKIKVIAFSNQKNEQMNIDYVREGALHFIEKNNLAIYKLIDCITEIYYSNIN